MHKVIGENALNEITLQDWFRRLKRGDWDITRNRRGDHKSGPASANRIAAEEEAFTHFRS
ncbi:hypothetical protein JGG47_23790 [Salmonella enterica subsp. enterica serovar Derby]|nr:hypothetical protein [Salmonella enterica subsp. enterica serovar Derby]